MSLWSRVKELQSRKGKPVPHVTNSPAGHADLALPIPSFGLKLLRQAAAPKQNVFLSPVSIFLALAMIENGAAGETKAAIRKVLELPADADTPAISQFASSLLPALQTHGETELAIANALWADIDSPISPDFVRLCQTVYGATAEMLDLRQASAAARINEWVSDKTRGRVRRIISDLPIGEAPVLVTNAVYFKGKFCAPFDEEATLQRPFHLADGNTSMVPMMHRDGLANSYRKGKGFEAAVLRYCDSGMELCVLLPDRGSSPEKVLTVASVQGLLESKQSCLLNLSLPRFTVDFSCDLQEILTGLGMGIAFQSQADFSALGSPLFFIGQILHTTRVEVYEKGTEAAAATSILIPLSAKRQFIVPKPKTLVFDRPFAVLLRDTGTGAIVFAGVVYDPQR